MVLLLMYPSRDGEGNKNGLASEPGNARNSRSTATACGASGTMCSRFIFIRSAGMSARELGRGGADRDVSSRGIGASGRGHHGGIVGHAGARKLAGVGQPTSQP